MTGEYDLKAHLPAHMDGAAIEAQRNRLLEQLIGRLGLPDGADASPLEQENFATAHEYVKPQTAETEDDILQ